jgi:hydrogenase/urease accessory protein HupE
VRGDSAGYSGIYVIPYQASNTIASLVSGLGIRLIGWHMPFIWSGSIFFVIGSGLLYRLTVNTAQATLVGYQILTGLGFGASVQLPYIAVQAVSKPDDISSASKTILYTIRKIRK